MHKCIRTSGFLIALLVCALAPGRGSAALPETIGNPDHDAAPVGQDAASPDPQADIEPEERSALKLSLDNGTDGQATPDWEGLKQDTLYFAMAQLVVIGVLYASPESVSRWSAEDKEKYSFEKWKENVSHPVWDTDRWWINYIMHPYWGGAYYVRASERGYGPTQSFWYSVLLSTMYEYGAEALFEPVSVQDLIFTPGLGFFVGRYFMSVRDGIEQREMNGETLTGTDRATLVLTDPLGTVNRGINKLLGREASLTLTPTILMAEKVAYLDTDNAGSARSPGDTYPGLRIHLVW